MMAIDENELREVGWMLAPLKKAPDMAAPLETEALRGETVAVSPANDEGWLRARLVADGYEGWLPAAALASIGPAFTHVVTAPRTLAFPAPDFKRPPIAVLSAGAKVRIARVETRYAVTTDGEYLIAAHLAGIGAPIGGDLVAIAERFLETPYLWGGKSAHGIDCSGLTQLAFQLMGRQIPRDSGPQERHFAAAVPLADIRRGDLLFWKGHVAIARDATSILHANAHHMRVAIEPLGEALARIEASGTPLSSVKRP